MTRHADIIIIGAGQASDPLARALIKAGKQVVLVERKHLGGSCINFGCTPTKAVLASARVAHQARRAGEFGVDVSGVIVDFARVLERARRMVEQARANLQRELEGKNNPVLLRGHARLQGRDAHGFQVQVDEETVLAPNVVLDTGTRTLIPPIPGLEQTPFLHAGNWLNSAELPEHLVILGGGYIGLEMGQFYRRMGSCVTLVDRGDQVIEREDEEIARALQAQLEAEGVVFHLGVDVTNVEKLPNGVGVSLNRNGGSSYIDASHLFVAAGRKPNTDDLGLETVGVALDEAGIVVVNERLQTNMPGIWACGDIRGGPQFTHASWDDARILESQLVGDGARTTDRIVPYAIFTDPQLGRVGMTETEARRAGKQVKIARYLMADNDRAKEAGETAGRIKVVIDQTTDRILGAAVLASEGAEMVHVYLHALHADTPWTRVRDCIHIHPTFSEALQDALLSLDDA